MVKFLNKILYYLFELDIFELIKNKIKTKSNTSFFIYKNHFNNMEDKLDAILDNPSKFSHKEIEEIKKYQDDKINSLQSLWDGYLELEKKNKGK